MLGITVIQASLILSSGTKSSLLLLLLWNIHSISLLSATQQINCLENWSKSDDLPKICSQEQFEGQIVAFENFEDTCQIKVCSSKVVRSAYLEPCKDFKKVSKIKNRCLAAGKDCFSTARQKRVKELNIVNAKQVVDNFFENEAVICVNGKISTFTLQTRD